MATTTRQKKEIVRRSFDAWNEADVETFDELVATDAEYHDPMTPPDLPSGPEGEKRLLELYQSANIGLWLPPGTASIMYNGA